MNTKKLVKNAIYNSSSWGINAIIAFFITPFLVLKLTVEGYGVYALITGLIGFYGLLDLDLGRAVTKFVAHYNAENNIRAIHESINAALIIQLIIGVSGSIVLFLFSKNIILLLHITKSYFNDAYIGIHIVAFSFLLNLLTATFLSALNGLQLYNITSKIEILNNLVLNILILVLLILGYGLIEIFISYLVSSIVNFIINLVIVKTKFPKWNIFIKVSIKRIKELFGFGSYMVIARTSNLFSNYLTKYLVGFILGPAAVTFYVVPNKILAVIGGVLSNAFTVIFPFASDLNAREDFTKIKKLFSISVKIFISLSLPLFLFTIVFSKEILSLWISKQFAIDSWQLLSLLSISGFIGSLSTVPNNILLGLGKTRILGLFALLTLSIYIITFYVMPSIFGLLGVGIAFVLSTIPGIILMFLTIKNIIKLNFYIILRDILSLPLIMLVLFYILVFSLKIYANNLSILLGGLTIAISVVYYSILFFKNIPKTIKRVEFIKEM